MSSFEDEVAHEVSELRSRLGALLRRLEGPTPPTERGTQTDGAVPKAGDAEAIRMVLMDKEHNAHLHRVKTDKLARRVAALEKQNKNLVEVADRLRSASTLRISPSISAVMKKTSPLDTGVLSKVESVLLNPVADLAGLEAATQLET